MKPTEHDPWAAGVADGRKVLAGPEQVVVDLTNRCNLHCLGCWTRSPLLRDKRPAPGWHHQTLPGQLVRELIDELARLGSRIIRFTGGGEPLLHRDLRSLVERSKAAGLRVGLTTNLTLLSPRGAARLAGTGLDELAASVWAADRATYRLTHPESHSSTFDRVSRALESFCAAKNPGQRVTVANVISNLNYHSLPALIDWATDCGADSVYLAVLDPIPNRTDCLLLSSNQRLEALELLNQAEERARLKGLELENLVDFKRRLGSSGADRGFYDRAAVAAMPCHIGWIFCRIMADGAVVPCCRAVMKVMGNLHQDNFGSIWNCRAYNEFRHLAQTRPKSDPYLAEIGCALTCDNHAHNLDIQRRASLEHGSEQRIFGTGME